MEFVKIIVPRVELKIIKGSNAKEKLLKMGKDIFLLRNYSIESQNIEKKNYSFVIICS
jgi:hypothetical protein